MDSCALKALDFDTTLNNFMKKNAGRKACKENNHEGNSLL
jgi:hypothetical protein